MSTAATLWDRAAAWVRAELWYATTPGVIVTPTQRTVHVTAEARTMEVSAA